jgi:serine/threonine-protein kinase RsbW
VKQTYKTEGIEIRKACLDVESLFNEWGIDSIDIQDMVLAVDEALTNIKEHGYNDICGLVDVEVSIKKLKVDILIKDNAKPYNIDNIIAIDKSTYIESDKIGGFGVTIIKSLMDSVKLSRNNDENLLLMSKNINPLKK